MDTFRHPSQMRLFVIFAILLLAAPGIKKLYDEKISFASLKKARTATWAVIAIILIATLISFFDSSGLRDISFSVSGIKLFLENITLTDAIFINGVIQLIFLVLFLSWLKKYNFNKKLFSLLWAANLFVLAQLILPVSFVSQTPPGAINAYIHRSPKGFPVKDLDSTLLSQFEYGIPGEIVNPAIYNKRISISRTSASPASLDELDLFLSNEKLYAYVANQPVAYLANAPLTIKDSSQLVADTLCKYVITDTSFTKDSCSAGNFASVKKISANRFEIATTADTRSLLVLTQSYHHHWKVWVDAKKEKVYKANLAFMATPLSPGQHTVVFKFIPYNTITAVWIMIATILILLAAGIISLVRKNNFQQV